MEDTDYEYILSILKSEEDNSILQQSQKSIDKRKKDVIEQLMLPKVDSRELLKKLKTYRYVMELPDLEIGSYIRWINLNHPESICLTNGSFICDIMILEDGIQVRCKNRLGGINQIRFDEHLIFQKLSDQENILLKMMECLEDAKISF